MLKRTIPELVLLLREGGHISIEVQENYSVSDLLLLAEVATSSLGSLELRQCDSIHTSDLIMLIKAGKNKISLAL